EQGATRTNISLPRDLKARMDAVKEAVNWSAIAAHAFEQKLAELNARKKGAKMEDVIARMKAAEEEDSNQAFRAGNEAGEVWARERERPKQRRRRQELEGTQEGVAGTVAIWNNGMNQGHVLGLFHWLTPNRPQGNRVAEWEAAEEFWARILGDGWD